MEQFRGDPRFCPRLIHTGQHFSPEMSDAFFRDLAMPEPDEYLGVPPGSQTEQTTVKGIPLPDPLKLVFLNQQKGRNAKN